MTTHKEDKRSPILGSWRNVYAVIIGTLIAVILLLYFFTAFFR